MTTAATFSVGEPDRHSSAITTIHRRAAPPCSPSSPAPSLAMPRMLSSAHDSATCCSLTGGCLVHHREKTLAHRDPDLLRDHRGGLLLRRQDPGDRAPGPAEQVLLPFAPPAFRQEPAARHPALPVPRSPGALRGSIYS